MRTVIKVEGPDGFFKRGKVIAKLADQGKAIPCEHINAFEDPQDMARLIATAKRSAKRKPPRRGKTASWAAGRGSSPRCSGGKSAQAGWRRKPCPIPSVLEGRPRMR
ncbi:MAG: hypothetical protein HZB40_17945 [Rhodocyclales bacterium]|nr:hypothetical protein [Rhodocyclales bacterium]